MSVKKLKVFYLHIPKTGGQTLAIRMASAFPIGRSDYIGSGLKGVVTPSQIKSMFSNVDFIEKHVSSCVLPKVKGIDFLVTVRSPVAQITSNYFHILRDQNNNLNRVANYLSPELFFDQYGDFLGDFQTNYLLSALFGLDRAMSLKDKCFQLFSSLDLIRWVVPTENIDEFTRLWSMETGRSVPNSTQRLNEVRRDDKYKKVFDIVNSMPHLYSVDSLLWSAANDMYAKYRDGVFERAVNDSRSDNITMAYCADGNRGVWLKKGWYPPQVATPVGTAWWAGPSKSSEVFYRRGYGDRYIVFYVVVVCGVPHSSIYVSDSIGNVIPHSVDDAGGRWRFVVDVSMMSLNDSIWINVPRVLSPMMIDPETNDAERKSFATCDWSFSENIQV